MKLKCAPSPEGTYSQAVRAGHFLFISGQGFVDPESGEIVAHDVVGQNVYLSDIDDFSPMNGVYSGYFERDPPARTTIQASRPPLGILVEIDVIALSGF